MLAEQLKVHGDNSKKESEFHDLHNTFGCLKLNFTFIQDLFSDDHVIRNRFGQLGKEKRRRGRPTKSAADRLKEQEEQAVEVAKIEQIAKAEKESDEVLDENTAGRRKRKIKLPSRFQEVVQVIQLEFLMQFPLKVENLQGRELERIYVENGVIDRLENVSDNDCFTNEADVHDYTEGVIGHMEDTDGSQVVDLVFDSSIIGKRRKFLR